MTEAVRPPAAQRAVAGGPPARTPADDVRTGGPPVTGDAGGRRRRPGGPGGGDDGGGRRRERRTPEWLRWVRALGTGLYLGVLVLYVWKRGLPLDREQVMIWIVAGLVISTLGRPRSWQIVTDWLPFALLMVAYDYSRGFARTIDLPIHFTPQIDVDKFLFFGHVPTVWLQEHLVSPKPHWWQVFITLAYLTHFILPFAVAGVLWFRNRASFLAFAGRFLTLAYAGLATYIVFPAAPPWIASETGPSYLRNYHRPYIGEVHRVVNQAWDLLGLHRARTWVEKGQATVNLYAAVPSLHAAFAALISVFLWTRVSRWWRPLLVLYPLLMGFALVFGGEHYVSDVLLGWLYVAAVMLGWNRWDRHRAAKRAAAAAGADDAGPGGDADGGDGSVEVTDPDPRPGGEPAISRA